MYIVRPSRSHSRPFAFAICASFFSSWIRKVRKSSKGSSAASSSEVGSSDFNRSGNACVRRYAATPIGLLISRKAYSTINLLRSLQRIRPRLGWSFGRVASRSYEGRHQDVGIEHHAHQVLLTFLLVC